MTIWRSGFVQDKKRDLDMRALMSVVTVLIVFASCHEIGNEVSTEVTAKTEKAIYILGDSITFVVSNGTTSAIRLPTCCGSRLSFYVDRIDNGTWVEHEARYIPCLFACPSMLIVVRAGAPSVQSVALTDRGTFRLRIPYGGLSGNLMEREVITNPFIVR